MQSRFFLDNQLIENIRNLNHTVNENQYWEDEIIQEFIIDANILITQAQTNYKQLTGGTLDDACRQIFIGSFTGNYAIFVEHFNCIIVLRKLIYRLDWYMKCGTFPD